MLFSNEFINVHKETKILLTAASTFAGDSSFGLESIDMILKTMLSTCKNQLHITTKIRDR